MSSFSSTGPSDDLDRVGTHAHKDYAGHRSSDSEPVGAAGFGNKTNTSSSDYNDDTRLGGATSTDSYTGGSDSYGSGATGGAGYGNKSSNSGSHEKGGDSTMGKLMEKAGSMMKNPKMEQKGLEKREQAGYDDNTSSFDRNDNY
ncbi:hypothetical protein MBLNU457_6590t1 [Dothideomycetes sp. NU457]